MRIKISHETSYAYEPPARSIIQVLRLTPRSFDAQYVVRWRISTDIDCTLRQSEDSLGNIVHSFSHPGPVERIGVIAEGEIETFDAVGVVRGSVEPLPPEHLSCAPRIWPKPTARCGNSPRTPSATSARRSIACIR